MVQVRRIGPRSLRLYVVRRRVHHFLTGAVLVAVGAVLMLHDRHDRHVALRDFFQDRS